MGCGCKKDGFEMPEKTKFSKLTNKEKGKLFVHYFFKVIGFLVGVLLLPIINLAIIWFMFNTIVLTRDVNVANLLNRYFNGKKDDEHDDDDDDDFEDLTEDDVIMMDVEDITEKN